MKGIATKYTTPKCQIDHNVKEQKHQMCKWGGGVL